MIRPSSSTDLNPRPTKKPCVQEVIQPVSMTFVIDLINQWDFAAKNNVNTDLRLKLCNNTFDATAKLIQIESSSSIEEKGDLCIYALNKFNSLSSDNREILGQWIGNHSSYTDNGAYHDFSKFIKIFINILRNPDVNQYIKWKQNIKSKYAQITETAKTTIYANGKGFPCDIDIVNLINNELDDESSQALTSTSRNHYNIRRSNLINDLYINRNYREYQLSELTMLLGDFTSKVRKISLKRFTTGQIDLIASFFPALESLSIKARENAALVGIEKLSKLTNLNLGNSKIDSLDFLKPLTLTSLSTLSLCNCKQIKSFDTLASCQGLTALDLSSTSIKNLDFLTKLSSLKEINISDCNKLNLSNIKEKYTNIHTLDLGGNNVSLPILDYFPNLTTLSLRFSDIDNPHDLYKYFKFGKVTYPNGDIFQGNLYENYKEGVLTNHFNKIEGKILNKLNEVGLSHIRNSYFKSLHGRGVWSTHHGFRYEGEFVNGTIMGEAKIIYPDGSLYIGSTLDHLRHGKGVFTSFDGTRYEGEFDRGNPVGEVKINYPDGNLYIGSLIIISYSSPFPKYNRHGKGAYTLANGTRYEGEFLNDKLVGEAKINYPDGSIYVGSVLNGKPHGRGVYIYSNGDRYEGEFIDGKRVDHLEIAV